MHIFIYIFFFYSSIIYLREIKEKRTAAYIVCFKMIYLLLSRSITWPFGFNSNNKSILITDNNNDDQTKSTIDHDDVSPLISNKNLLLNNNQNLTKNSDENKSLIDQDRITNVPLGNLLTILGKHYLTREDLEHMIQARFKQETPYDRVERFLWKE